MIYKFEKQANGMAKNIRRDAPFARANKSHYMITFSAPVRDFVLPHRFVNIEIDDENGFLILTPSDDGDYAFDARFHSSSSICYARLAQHIEFPDRERIPVEFSNGKIIIKGRVKQRDEL